MSRNFSLEEFDKALGLVEEVRDSQNAEILTRLWQSASGNRGVNFQLITRRVEKAIRKKLWLMCASLVVLLLAGVFLTSVFGNSRSLFLPLVLVEVLLLSVLWVRFIPITQPHGKQQKEDAEMIVSFSDFLKQLQEELIISETALLGNDFTSAPLSYRAEDRLAFLAEEFLLKDAATRSLSAEGRDCDDVGQAFALVGAIRSQLKQSHEFFRQCELVNPPLSWYYDRAKKKLAEQKTEKEV